MHFHKGGLTIGFMVKPPLQEFPHKLENYI